MRHTEPWPVAGQRLRVDVLGGPVGLTGVVDDVRPPAQVHLREPVPPNGSVIAHPAPGTRVRLVWTTPAGEHTLHAVVEDQPAAPVPLWRLAPDSEPVVRQRREFIRVADTMLVQLRRGTAGWTARVADLSEGGVRCVLLDDNDLAVGDDVTVRMELEERAVEVAAVVLAVVAEGGSRTSARLRFGELKREGDLIRRRVLEQQRRARLVVQR